VGQILLIIKAPRSHSVTRHSVELLWTNDQPGAETSTGSTQNSQETDIPAAGGILTRNYSKRAAGNPRLRQSGHWDRQTSHMGPKVWFYFQYILFKRTKFFRIYIYIYIDSINYIFFSSFVAVYPLRKIFHILIVLKLPTSDHWWISKYKSRVVFIYTHPTNCRI
jgi:hypothetical protein